MRYTEAAWRASPMEMLQDIEKDTVEWVANFDGSAAGAHRAAGRGCPTCWSTAPAASPSGMATNIPPHNLGEVADALVYTSTTGSG
jgi:DNA gyrase subunit A